VALGRRVCDASTGAYCRARLKIPFAAVRAIVVRLALEAEAGFSHHDIDEDIDISLSLRVVDAGRQKVAFCCWTVLR